MLQKSTDILINSFIFLALSTIYYIKVVYAECYALPLQSFELNYILLWLNLNLSSFEPIFLYCPTIVCCVTFNSNVIPNSWLHPNNIHRVAISNRIIQVHSYTPLMLLCCIVQLADEMRQTDSMYIRIDTYRVLLFVSYNRCKVLQISLCIYSPAYA